MEPLFPELPEELAALTDEELSALLEEHEIALSKVEADDPKYIGDLSAEEVLAELELGVEQIKQIRDLQAARLKAEEEYKTRKAELAAQARPFSEEKEETDEEVEETAEVEGEEAEVSAEAEGAEEVEGEEEPEVVEETAEVAVVAAAVEPAKPEPKPEPVQPKVVYRRPPQPDADRTPGAETTDRPVLVAAAGVEGVRSGVELDSVGLAQAMIDYVSRRSRPSKHAHGVEEKLLVAAAQYRFPEERRLYDGDHSNNVRKLRAIGNPFLGNESTRVLVASGGLCAPLTPLYDIPDFAVTDRPVRDSLPSFQADRGGVSVPSVSTIGDITTAITVIEEAADALGGTYATKSCQDLDCPTWTDVAIGIISHCREYGNLNARAWPEGIAHENALTMAAHARTAETRLLDRIKALSVNVTQAAIGAQLNAYASLVYAITRMEAGVRYRLRLPKGVRYRVLMPEWVPDLLAADSGSTQFTRYDAQAAMQAHLGDLGISISWYKDDVGGGTSQGFADESAGAIDDFPDDVQFAFFVEGEFLHLDGGVLELGLVRDSTLNSTNDYQVFGETFENVARIGPTQGALWATVDVCPTGGFPALISGLTC